MYQSVHSAVDVYDICALVSLASRI